MLLPLISTMNQSQAIHPIVTLLTLGLWLYCATAGAAQGVPDAASIVEKADHIRFPPQGFQVDTKITTINNGSQREVRHYRILSKGNENTLVMTTAPAVDRGQIMLMKGQDLWIFMPKVSQPVRLPLSQRLTGQVANGDLARANFSGDYDAKLLRVDTIKQQEYYVLELTAANRRVTYHRVLYWVEKQRYRPYRAEFYALSGNLLKTAHYRGYTEMGGAMRPSKLYMQDPYKKGSHSLMEYGNMRLRALPDKFFTKNYLKKLQ